MADVNIYSWNLVNQWNQTFTPESYLNSNCLATYDYNGTRDIYTVYVCFGRLINTLRSFKYPTNALWSGDIRIYFNRGDQSTFNRNSISRTNYYLGSSEFVNNACELTKSEITYHMNRIQKLVPYKLTYELLSHPEGPQNSSIVLHITEATYHQIYLILNLTRRIYLVDYRAALYTVNYILQKKWCQFNFIRAIQLLDALVAPNVCGDHIFNCYLYRVNENQMNGLEYIGAMSNHNKSPLLHLTEIQPIPLSRVLFNGCHVHYMSAYTHQQLIENINFPVDSITKKEFQTQKDYLLSKVETYYKSMKEQPTQRYFSILGI